MNDFSVRELGADDLSLARELFDLWRRGDDVSAPPATDETLTDLLRRDDFHVIVAFIKDEIVGGLTAYELEMVTANATELFVYEVSVEAEYRRRGVGRAVAFYAACGLKREEVAWFTQEWGAR